MHHVKEVKLLVDNLNKHRHAYYNLNAPEISDAEYDRMYEQLESLEKETGIIYSNSPTQTVGYPPVSELEKVPHPHPLLSLDKTKQVEDLCRFCGNDMGVVSACSCLNNSKKYISKVFSFVFVGPSI